MKARPPWDSTSQKRPSAGKSTETESDGVASGWRLGKGRDCFMGLEFSFGVVEMDQRYWAPHFKTGDLI